MYTHICIYIYIYIHTHTHVYIHTYTYVYWDPELSIKKIFIYIHASVKYSVYKLTCIDCLESFEHCAMLAFERWNNLSECMFVCVFMCLYTYYTYACYTCIHIEIWDIQQTVMAVHSCMPRKHALHWTIWLFGLNTYICINTCTRIFIHIYTHKHLYTHTLTDMHAQAWVGMHAHTCAYNIRAHENTRKDLGLCGFFGFVQSIRITVDKICVHNVRGAPFYRLRPLHASNLSYMYFYMYILVYSCEYLYSVHVCVYVCLQVMHVYVGISFVN
jgi:hypothetical protein